MKDKSLTRVSVFLTSQIISLFGSAIVSYSIVWYITLKTSSTMALAISIVCTYMPQIVISMFSGTWGDKFNKKNLIIIGDTITGISTLILAILFINGFDSLYLLYGACALRSVGSGIQTPLEHAFLPLICPEEKLTKINGIYATASSAINILSPAMAGVLLNVMDFGHTLFIDCITALLAIIVLLKLKYKNTISSNKDTSTLSDFLEGVKYFKQHIFLGRLILFYLLFSLFFLCLGILSCFPVCFLFCPFPILLLTLREMTGTSFKINRANRKPKTSPAVVPMANNKISQYSLGIKVLLSKNHRLQDRRS